MTQVHDAGWTQTGGTASFNVIVARERSQSQILIHSIERLGGRAVALPLIEVDLNPSLQAISCVRSIGDADVLAATSVNALKALGKAVNQERLRTLVTLPRTCYVMGQASAREAKKLGFVAKYFSGVKTGLEFARQLASVLPPKQRIFFPHGNLAAEQVPEVLRQAGHDVTTCTLYVTRDAQIDTTVWQQTLGQSKWAYLVLYSPSAVHSLYRQWLPRGSLDAFRVVCIGPTTAAACRQLGIKVAGVAHSPTDDAVLSELTRLRES